MEPGSFPQSRSVRKRRQRQNRERKKNGETRVQSVSEKDSKEKLFRKVKPDVEI
jgi:hypothetical protein